MLLIGVYPTFKGFSVIIRFSAWVWSIIDHASKAKESIQQGISYETTYSDDYSSRKRGYIHSVVHLSRFTIE